MSLPGPVIMRWRVSGPGQIWCVEVWDPPNTYSTNPITTLIISQRLPVKTSLIYKMEWSATTLYQLMATDDLLLWPPTPVLLLAMN